MKPTGATKEWTLSKPLTNQIISDDFRRGLTGSISIYGIDVPEDSGDRIHFAGVVVFGDEQRAKDIIAAINERERLREGLRQVRAMFFEHAESGGYTEKGKLVKLDNEQHPWIPGVEAPRAIAIIDAALNEVEG